ncbi:type III PLP-dependent enzyme [Micromonosporaceae bacterium Da 78-11]
MLRSALAAADEDQIIFDLDGLEAGYDRLIAELPGVDVRFALKACPLDEVLQVLADRGAGFDAASPNEVTQALRTGVGAARIHYGNTVKSDQDIAAAYRLGIRLFATDSVQDVQAVAANAPGARVFCRLATTGAGALWGLSDKFGCSGTDAVAVLEAARERGLTPAGLSLHVGSQQMSSKAWRAAFADVAGVIRRLSRRGIVLDHVNLGGGLPALGYLDRQGRPLAAPLGLILAEIRDGIRRLRQAGPAPLDVVLEPGRHLVADQGAIRAHAVRLTTRRRQGNWLYLSCGKFNGLYEMDQLQYRLEFPTHPDGPYVPAVIAGPTCDSDDAFAREHPVAVPAGLTSGDPVWIHATGAYAVSYTTVGFNGFDPLPCRAVRGEVLTAPGGRLRES